MDTINRRLALLRESLKMNKTEFSEAIGLETSRYNKLENGNGKPAGDALILMAEKLPKVNMHWLLTGKGQMFTELQPDIVKQPAMSALQESQELREMRKDRDMWREMALTLAKTPSAGLSASTGTDHDRFSLSNRLAAELTEVTPLKKVS